MRQHRRFPAPYHRCHRCHRCLRVRLLRVIVTVLALQGPCANAADSPNDQHATLSRSVGRLLVPAIRYEEGRARHYDEQCSATLVSLGARPRSRLLLSAWHCLEDYRDLSRPITFEVVDGEAHEARPVASGGSMHSDWALLRLARELPHPLPLAADIEDTTTSVRLAGYPRNAATLRTQDCRNTGQDGRDRRTGCVARRGASGGAVISLSGDGSSRFVGVISRGDGVSQSIYVPIERILPRIRNFLDAQAATLP